MRFVEVTAFSSMGIRNKAVIFAFDLTVDPYLALTISEGKRETRRGTSRWGSLASIVAVCCSYELHI